MPKRANHEGYIRQRPDGRWEGQYVAGVKPNGRIDRKSVYGKTQEEAREKLQKVLSLLSTGSYVQPKQMTLKGWLDIWHKEYVLPSRKPTTAASYYDIIHCYLLPDLGQAKLQKLRVEQVQALYNSLSRDGKAPATVAKVHRVLHTAMEQAKKNKLIQDNPTTGANLPKQEQEEIKYLSVEQQAAVLGALPDTAGGRALRFILATGVRAAEVIGLRWEDVKKDHIGIIQTIQRTRNFEKDIKSKTKFFKTSPKSKSGQRRIPLTGKIKALLNEQKRKQNEMRLKLGQLWADNDLVFASETGAPMDSRNLTRTLHRVLEKLGFEQRGLHALRHTFGTRAIENGMDPRTLSELMGHKDVATTLRLYVHSSMDTKQRAMNAMDAFL